MRSALIDLGTNSVRLHIFEQNGKGELRRIFQRKDMIQLGVGLFETGDFTKRAREAAVSVFKEFKDNLKSFEVSEVHTVATCAMREAKSGDKLRDEIEKKSGIPLEIISGKKEAKLIAQGIIEALGPFEKTRLLVDIGGGSTELSFVKGKEILFATSTPLGAVRCQEVTLKDTPPSKKAEKELRAIVRSTVDNYLTEDVRRKAKIIMGSSGSIRAIVRLIRNGDSTESICTSEELSEFAKSLRGKDVKDLLKHPTLEPKRAKIIFSATVILDEIAQHLGIKAVHAVPLGLKDGLIARLRDS